MSNQSNPNLSLTQFEREYSKNTAESSAQMIRSCAKLLAANPDAIDIVILLGHASHSLDLAYAQINQCEIKQGV